MTTENNDNGYLKTQFDGREAEIVGNHPHAGSISICLGCANTHAGYGLVFKNKNSEETFFVFKPETVKWRQ